MRDDVIHDAPSSAGLVNGRGWEISSPKVATIRPEQEQLGSRKVCTGTNSWSGAASIYDKDDSTGSADRIQRGRPSCRCRDPEPASGGMSGKGDVRKYRGLDGWIAELFRPRREAQRIRSRKETRESSRKCDALRQQPLGAERRRRWSQRRYVDAGVSCPDSHRILVFDSGSAARGQVR